MSALGDDAGFLSRWSRRKALAREGVALPEPPPAPVAIAVAPVAEVAPSVDASVPVAEPPPPPTLDDVATLTPASDFGRFVARGVAPEVKNAALKKLFADPHFNVMDGLDTYIEDFGRPDPLPEGMLRQMAQARFLGLFTEEPAPATPLPAPVPTDEDADLRLQPDDAPGPAGDPPGPGRGPGRED